MARTDFNTPRLCVQDALASDASIALLPDQTNYLLNVLRLREGARVLIFNGRDGEFAAALAPQGRKGAALRIERQIRPQEFPRAIDYLFAPLKHARLDYVAQKAVEMGVRRLCPVITRRTQATRVNIERLRANAREAAEQCGVIWLAEVDEARPLAQALERRAPGVLVFCDEDAAQHSAAAALAARAPPEAVALLIGPEGGFDEEERAMILRAPDVVRLSLGPRILRADTAAVAALALVQAHWGDWR